MGKPVHFITGAGVLTGREAPIAAAGFAILGYVAKLCGKYKVPIRYNMIFAVSIPISIDLIKTGYALAGVPEMYNDEMVHYIGEHQYGMISAVQRYIYDEKPAVNMMFGPIHYETLTTMGAAATVGAVQAAGTPRMYYHGYLASVCDYSMVGDEMYAAAAKVSGIPADIAIFRGQDIMKIICIIIFIVSAIFASAGMADLITKMINF
jgi:hypothetical protein